MERSRGVYALFQSAWIYRAFQSAVIPARFCTFIQRALAAKSGDRVFDIGCGPGDTLELLPEVDYFGIDLSQAYITAARERFKGSARFACAGVGDFSLQEEEASFDIAIAKGVVHHLDDTKAVQLFELAKSALKPGGRLITLDGCFTDNQPRFSRLVVSRDRGQFVRDVDAYRELADSVFDKVEIEVRHDLLRIPYSHLIMTCTA